MHAVVKWMDNHPDKVREQLPEGWSFEQARRSAMAVLQADKVSGGNIAKCDPGSLSLAFLQAASLGLSLDSHDAYIIPYNKVATLSVGYRGMIKLAKKSGEILHLRAEVVYEGETFVLNNSSDTSRRGFDHPISIPRGNGEIIAAYVCIDRRDGLTDFEVMDRAELDQVRKASKSSNGPAWRDWFGEMAKKAVIRRALKRYTLQPEVERLFMEDAGRAFDVGVEVVAQSTTSLNRRLGLLPEDPAPSQTPEEPPAGSPPPLGAGGSDGDEDAALRRSLGQLLRGISGPVDEAKDLIMEMDEGSQSEWLTTLKETEPSERAALVEQIAGGE